MTSYNKQSIFTAKHKPDNEETPLKQPHQDAFTPKQENLERIDRLHIKCGYLDTEQSCFLKSGYNINNMRMCMWRLRKISLMPTVRKIYIF